MIRDSHIALLCGWLTDYEKHATDDQRQHPENRGALRRHDHWHASRVFVTVRHFILKIKGRNCVD
jgi:hypothetical protein